MKQVIKLSNLQNEGKKVARLSGNRNLNEKIVKSKKTSMKSNGLLIPAVIVDAADALKSGLEVIDFTSKEVITEANASQYVVLIDANHRYQAHLELTANDAEYNKEFFLMYPLNSELSIPRMLSEINTATVAWKGSDYGKGAKMLCSQDIPLLNGINELTSKGYSLDAACKWLTFHNKINKTILAKAMNGEISDELTKDTEAGILRGKNLLDAAMSTLDEKVLKTRIIIDWIIQKFIKTPADELYNFESTFVKFFSSLDRKDAKAIENAKGKRGESTKEHMVYNQLDALYKKFLVNQNSEEINK
jgi:hypothetical protein